MATESNQRFLFVGRHPHDPRLSGMLALHRTVNGLRQDPRTRSRHNYCKRATEGSAGCRNPCESQHSLQWPQ
jgi:hypothetical protein